MKKGILIAFLCFMAYGMMAQEEEKTAFNAKKFEINIGFADIFAKNNWWYDYYYYDYTDFYYYMPYGDYYRQPRVILGLKCHTDKGAFRMGLSYRQNKNKLTDTNDPDRTFSSNHFGAGLNLGYEWHKTLGRVNIFYGFDVTYNKLHYNFKWEEEGPQYTSTSEYIIDENCFGASPLIGVNVFITPALSVGTEVKFNAEFMKGNNTSKYHSDNPYNYDDSENKEDRSGFRTYIGPLGFLSLNIHL